MERRIVGEVAISDIEFNEDLYPRTGYNWLTGYDYSESIKSGANFPIITLAIYKDKKYLIDGKHRIEANKILKNKTIKAEVFTGWSWEKMFEESVTRNITHGKVLSPYEKRRIALKLKQMKYPEAKIGKLLNIPVERLEKFVAHRLINTLTGEVISESIVKSPLKHIAGQTLEDSHYTQINENQNKVYSKSQLTMFDEIIQLFENNLIDFNDKAINERVQKIQQLIEDKLPLRRT